MNANADVEEYHSPSKFEYLYIINFSGYRVEICKITL